MSNGTKISLYADDTAVFYSDFDVKIVQKKLQLDMNKLSKWFSDNGMIVNSDKTKVMLFSSRQKKQNCNFQIYMNGKLLENVDKLKHLGVTIEKSLNWSYHVDDVIKKIVRSIACIRRIKSCLTIDNLKQLNFTLILPYLDYCCTVWGSLTKRDMLRIQKCQNKYARMILNADYNTPSLGLLHTLKWQPVDQRINFHYYVTVYKSLHNLAPQYLCTLVKRRDIAYCTRYTISSQLYLPKPRTEYRKRSFSYVPSKLYNNLPLYVQISPTLSIIKKRLQQHQSFM